MHNRRIVLITIALGIILSISFSGCDYTYKIQLPDGQLDKLSLISTYPGHIDDNGEMTPVCSMDDPLAVDPSTNKQLQANGFILNFVMKLTGKKHNVEPFAFPGDMLKHTGYTDQPNTFPIVTVNEKTNMGTSGLKLNAKCLDTLSSNKLITTCNGTENPPNNKAGVNFNTYFPCENTDNTTVCRHHTDKNDVGVIVMFDNSGSMDGWVNPNTFQEVGETGGSLQGNESMATDNGWNAREQAWANLVNVLSPNYKRMVLRFGEFAGEGNDKLILAGCANPDGLPQEQLWDNCFGVNQDIADMRVLKKPVKNMGNITKGRTPLWYALKRMYDYLKTKTDLKVKHIIVVDDSPDTCTKKSPFYNWAIDAACSSVGFDEFKQELLTDLKANPEQNIHISFIQIQSKGYMERDTEQAEVSCLTRGHYIFLNARQWGDDDYDYKSDLSKALQQSMSLLAYSLQGFWQYGFKLVAMSDPTKAVPGTLAVASGDLTLTGGDPDSLSTGPTPMYFDIGSLNMATSLADNRAVIRIPCSTDTKCTTSGSNMDVPGNFLDASCIAEPQCVESLGLCHWAYAGKDFACETDKKCTLGKCQ